MFPKFSFRSKAASTPSIITSTISEEKTSVMSPEIVAPRSPMPWENQPIKRIESFSTTSSMGSANTYAIYHQKSLEKDPITGAPLFPTSPSSLSPVYSPDALSPPFSPRRAFTSPFSPRSPSFPTSPSHSATFPPRSPMAPPSPHSRSRLDDYFEGDENIYEGLRARKWSSSRKTPECFTHDLSETATLVEGQEDEEQSVQPLSRSKTWLSLPGRKFSAVVGMNPRRPSAPPIECQSIEAVCWGTPDEWQEKGR